MHVVYPVCCGIDVHKRFLIATIITTKDSRQSPVYEKRRFSTFNRQILAMKQWLLDHQCYDVCMESTGKYWVPIFNLLEDTLRVTLANPKWVAAVKGNKDDVKDSKWIGELFRLGLVPGSFIPPKDIRVLREYTRYRFKLTAMRASEKNRLQNALTVCNFGLDSVVSDVFGVAATKIRRYLVKTASPNLAYCKKLIHPNMKHSPEEILDSIDGFSMTPFQRTRITLIDHHIESLTSMLEQVDQLLDQMVEPYEPVIQLLTKIPGVQRQSAITILSEIGADMAAFQSSKKLCSWAGLTPMNHQSAGKKKSVRISRAGVYLKPALVQCAHTAVNDKHCPYYRLKYERLMQRRGKKRGIIAIARMILTAIYHMIQTGEVWHPVDLEKKQQTKQQMEQGKQQTIKQAIALLVREGLMTEPERVTSSN